MWGRCEPLKTELAYGKDSEGSKNSDREIIGIRQSGRHSQEVENHSMIP